MEIVLAKIALFLCIPVIMIFFYIEVYKKGFDDGYELKEKMPKILKDLSEKKVK